MTNINRPVINAITLFLLLGVIPVSAQSSGRNQVINIIHKVNRHWQAIHPEPGSAFWNNAAYHTGNMEAYFLTGEESYRKFSETWAEHNEWKGAKSGNKSEWKYTYGETDEYVLFGDWQICFQTYIDLYNLQPEEKKIKRAKEVMEYEMSTPNNDYWWWVDGLYMVMPVMTKLYKVIGNELYLQKLYEYFSYAKQLMYDPESGFFYRDAKYIYPKHITNSGKKDFWARGNGWFFAAIPRIIKDLPETDIHRPEYIQTYQSLANALLHSQQKEGYWTRSLLDAEQASGPETSGTAFFTYGLLWGINNGFLDPQIYEPVAYKAWDYLINTALQEDGTVGYVQPIGEKAIQNQMIDKNSTADFGVGAFLLAASEMVRCIDRKEMNGWAQNSINTVIFRSNSIVSYDTVQFIAYYNPEGYLCIGKKNMEKKIWDIRQTAFKGNIQDAHNSISIMTDGEGYLHVAWNHHDSPLNYTKSKFPLSADLEEKQAMTGRMENKVTYPQFYKTNSGNLLFMYREGQSGKGNLALKSYNTQTKKWTQLHDNLIDGEGLRNAYWQACIDKNDVVHLSWVWRESPDVASNHDMCYARSTDGGKNWINSKGIKYNLPITAKNAEYVSYIPQNSELINQTSMTADQEGRPYIATYYRKTNTSVPQYHIIYPDHTNEWKDISLDFRKTPFTLTGQGTKKIPISRPLILCRDNPEEKQFLLIYRDEERNCKISMAVCNNLTENQWISEDLTSYPVGDWEPTYDTERWKNQQVLNLFVQKTEQGDGEKTSALNSQPVSMLQVPFLSSYKQQNKEKQPDYQIQQVKLNHVELADRFWLPKIRIIQEKTIRYAFDKCTTEGRLENFVTAGKVINGGTGKTRGVMPFDDTDVYKTIEGAAYSLINAPDPSLMTYLDSIIEIIRSGQEPDGYLTTWRTIHPSRPPASWVKQGGGRWSDLGSSHELYNSGHLFEAAAAHYWATGKRNFLDIALKNADLLINVFGDSTNYEVPGHQIVETGLIKLYQITGKKEYLHLAKKFLDLRGDALHRSVYGAYSQDHLPVTQQIEAVGHAVRAMYMYAGMTDIAALYNDPAYLYAVWQLWENTSGKKIYITGGLGARHEGEAFGDNYELPNLTAYSETCAAIGGVYWNERMFRLTGEAKYYDLIERMLYNAVIAGISLNGTEFFYPNPLEADGKYPFNQGACTRQAWFDCSCCPTNLIRFIPFIPNLIYATQDDTVYINLFMSNKANIPVGKKEVEIEQKTDYPWNENIYLNIKTTQIFPFTIKIRIPGWARNEVVHSTLYSYVNKVDESYRILLNGMPIEGKLRNGYLEITRKWTTGDQIELQFPMTVRQVKANEKVTVNAGKTAIEYGPLVYCMEEIDNPSTFDNKREMNDAAEYTVEWKNDFLDGVNIIREKKNRNEQVLIPYYAWSNRGAGKMKVWK